MDRMKPALEFFAVNSVEPRHGPRALESRESCEMLEVRYRAWSDHRADDGGGGSEHGGDESP